MKKIFIIFRFLLFFIFFILHKNTFSQNVGIGTTTPTRAKLEVFGTAGSGYTSAIFGSDGAGISMQRNWPTIGFNQYNNVSSKFMTTGYAAIQYLDPASGVMGIDMLGNGTANTATTTQIRALTILNNGNVGIKTNGASNASLNVARGINSEGAAIIGGTQYASYFGFAATEDTYIRAGKDGGNIIINDIPNGNIQMGNGSTKVGINTLPYAPLTALEVNGAVSLRAAVTTVFSGTTITVGDRSYISIINGTASAFPQFYLTNGINPGQILILQGDQTNARYVYITDGSNVNVNGTMTLAKEDTLTLIWSGSKWVEMCRSQNAF
jgi:hypothetical protein